MRFDLKTPCKNCPWRNDGTEIRFACRERAEEIEEMAYRHGFPCHLSAELREDLYGEEDGYHAVEDSQHCVGFIITMFKGDGAQGWPGNDNGDDLAEEIAERIDWAAPTYDSIDEWLDENPAR